MDQALAGFIAWGWRMVRYVKRSVCTHEFAIEDLRMIDANSDGDDRVQWDCAKCGKVFRAHCGLDIAPSNGATYRRTPLAEKRARELAREGKCTS